MPVTNKDIIEEISTLHEDKLSKEILVPLFMAMHNCRVEFVGGQGEKGKDIIIFDKKKSGRKYFIGVQVKKIKPNSNARSEDSFQNLLTQLSQAEDEEVICNESNSKVSLNELVFVTPFELGHKVKDQHYDALCKKLKTENIEIYDGQDIANLIKQHIPDLISNLYETPLFLTKISSIHLDNSLLMNALDHEKLMNVSDIYCEIDVKVGNEKYYKYLNERIIINSSKQPSIELPLKDIPIFVEQFNEQHKFLEKFLKINLFRKSDLEQLNKWPKTIERNAKNIKKAEKIVKTSRDEVQNLIKQSVFKATINNRLNEIRNDKSDTKKQTITDATVLFVLKEIQKSIKLNENLDFIERHKQYSDISILIDKQKLLIKAGQLYRKKDSQFTREKFRIPVSLKNVVKGFEEQKKLTSQKSSNLENCMAEFLTELEFLMEGAFILNQFEDYISFSNSPEFGYSLCQKSELRIDTFFDSGKNIAVLGGAGSGKTTNLQMYTYSRLKAQPNSFTLFATLNQIAKYAQKVTSVDFLEGIYQYLLNLGYKRERIQLIDILKQKSTALILDSVDEAIAEFPWIMKSLNEFSLKYYNVQIITSSRYSIPEEIQLPFAHISLLPFTQEQKEKFFKNYFKETLHKAEDIIKHLAQSSILDELVTNPLSATILAVLRDKEVPLPNSEAALYEARFELLSGKFDDHKQSKRLANSSKIIIEVSEELAFYLHSRKTREFTKEGLLDFLRTLNHIIMKDSQIKTLSEDLISSEIILSNNNSKIYSFGHLRFQEYLASKALVRKRSEPILKYMKDKWWHGTFIMMSQHNHDMKWFFDLALTHGYEVILRKLLTEMLSHWRHPDKALTSKSINQSITEASMDLTDEELTEDFADLALELESENYFD